MRTSAIPLLTAALMAGTACCHAGAASNPVGFVRVSLEPARTVAVADPFESVPPAVATAGTVARVGTLAAPGDLLHLWTGQAFNTYTWSGSAWSILGTLSPLPEARLRDSAGAGCLVTRPTPGSGEIALVGKVATATSRTLTVAAASWALLGCPYPVDLRLEDLVTAGAGTGDQVMIWDVAAQAWQAYRYDAGTWSRAARASGVVPAGAAFLYYNARESGTALTFRRP